MFRTNDSIQKPKSPVAVVSELFEKIRAPQHSALRERTSAVLVPVTHTERASIITARQRRARKSLARSPETSIRSTWF